MTSDIVGFEINNNNKKKISAPLKKSDRKLYEKYEKEVQQLMAEQKKIETRYNGILESKWWRYTSKVRGLIKK